MKKILLLLTIIASCLTVSASHFAGAELRYEFNGVNYTVELSLQQLCEPSQAQLTQAEIINIKSVSSSVNFNRVLQRVSTDTMYYGCTPGGSSCDIITSPHPGFVIAKYRDTVTLPVQAADWTFSFTTGTRLSSYNNIQGGMAYLYVEATLNNNVANTNSCAIVPTALNYYIRVNQVTTVPLTILDPDGDSIVYEFTQPLQSATTYVPYMPNHSVTTPLGLLSAVNTNPVMQTLAMNTKNVGKYCLAIRVKEYRNGILTGSFVRDFTVYVSPSNSTITYPWPAIVSSQSVYTCPGQVNSITVHFHDSTSKDSIYVEAQTPSVPGISFTTSISNGKPNASANFSWTTPPLLNPAATPFFAINLRVRDNACERAIANYAILVRVKQCTATDSVWPGDANGDYVVDILDPLALAVAMGNSGYSRVNATTIWQAQASVPWSSSFATTNVNMKHADCDGDGAATTADLPVIAANYGKVHYKQGEHHKQTAGPLLFADASSVILEPGTTVLIPIRLGDANTSISDFYGLAARVSINPTSSTANPVIPIEIITSGYSWIGTNVNSINFNKALSNNIIDWAHARTDHQNQAGNGVVGMLKLAIPANAERGSFINFLIDNVVMIDKDGFPTGPFTYTHTIGQIPFPVSIYELPKGLSPMNVMPNPSHNTATLQLMLEKAADVQLRVTDIMGKTVWQHTATMTAGNNMLQLPAQRLPAGMYTIHIHAGEWGSIPVVKWVKQ